MSNQVVSGVVDKVWTKDKATRYGDKKLHYCQVDGLTFSTGFKKVFNEGEMINAVVKFNYGELQYQPDVTATPGMAPAKPVAAATKGNFSGGNKSNYGNKGTFPVDPKDGQMSIIRQSSMNRAVEIMDQLVAGLWSDNDGVMTISQEDYMKQLFEIALEITDFSSGNDIMKLMHAKQAQKEMNGG